MNKIYAEIQEEFLNDMFENSSRLDREIFIARLRDQYSKYLVPHELRKMIFTKVLATQKK
jgi:hypothetical protein